MASLLALGSAALYGAADFLGGFASRRTNTLAIVVTSQCTGLALLALLLPLLPEAAPSTRDLAWGGVAGLTGGVGITLLFRALAVGRMAVVAPTTAVCSVMIPVATSVLLGERLGGPALLGIALAIVAIVLVSRQGTATSPSVRAGALPPGVGLALPAGVAIGLFFLALAETDAQAGMWPLVAARAVSVTLLSVLARLGGRPLRMATPTARIAIASGALDMSANALYLLATRYGPLSVAVTLSSLYPASTVILARVVLGEHLNGWQVAGVACALLAVALIVGGSGL
ncbi:MAG: DMT family transporter [Acidobacteria bacterium]|nr:DMT family transporter [Acidobacteriota bacterium]MYD71361.1 DMT family transporter [Acidobacteriota bacterium]MYJ06226.1 DMT family transporter [Acidobacteriota bacterium]